MPWWAWLLVGFSIAAVLAFAWWALYRLWAAFWNQD